MILSTALLFYCSTALAATPRVDALLDAMIQVESAGNPDAIGDGGRSIGPLQIQRAYWQDARVPWSYHQVKDPAKARATAIAYWRRYCPRALARGDLRTLAAVHNGGPRAPLRATASYWQKVSLRLQNHERQRRADEIEKGPK